MKHHITLLTLLLAPLAALHATDTFLIENGHRLIGAAGVNVSRDFPMKEDVPGEERFLDHKHHRSLWFAHSKVNGIDFWGEYLAFGKQEHTGFSETKATGNQGAFLAATKWVAPTGEAVLTDERRITITALPDGEKTMDFEITLKATEGDVLPGDTKEGTMALRLCPSLSMNSSKSFVNTGNSTGQACRCRRLHHQERRQPHPSLSLLLRERPADARGAGRGIPKLLPREITIP